MVRFFCNFKNRDASLIWKSKDECKSFKVKKRKEREKKKKKIWRDIEINGQKLKCGQNYLIKLGRKAQKVFWQPSGSAGFEVSISQTAYVFCKESSDINLGVKLINHAEDFECYLR